jgi:hypothetical protein
VNFFIVGEMAVLGDNESLLKALRDLQESPTYSVKGKEAERETERYSPLLFETA